MADIRDISIDVVETRFTSESDPTTGHDPVHDSVHDRVTEHLWLADALAHRFRHRGAETDDLVQVARGALVEAAQRYRPETGHFVSYAVPTINGTLKRYFRDHGWLVRPPRQTQEVAASIRRQWDRIAQEVGHLPRVEELANRLDQPVETVREAVQAGQGYTAAALEPTMAGLSAEDGAADLERVEAKVVVDGLLRRLRPEERRLLRLRFYEQRSQSDIATRLGVSQMQISRQLARLLRRTRVLLEADAMPQQATGPAEVVPLPVALSTVPIAV